MPNPSNSDLVGEALELSSRATPGPWTPYKGIDHRGSSVPKMIYAEDLLKVAQSFRPDGADAEFIAGARTLLPELAQQLEQAEQRELDNHHNAAKCSYCGDLLGKAERLTERYREALERIVDERDLSGLTARNIARAALTPDEGADAKSVPKTVRKWLYWQSAELHSAESEALAALQNPPTGGYEGKELRGIIRNAMHRALHAAGVPLPNFRVPSEWKAEADEGADPPEEEG